MSASPNNGTLALFTGLFKAAGRPEACILECDFPGKTSFPSPGNPGIANFKRQSHIGTSNLDFSPPAKNHQSPKTPGFWFGAKFQTDSKTKFREVSPRTLPIQNVDKIGLGVGRE